jgi:hypothetical protein
MPPNRRTAPIALAVLAVCGVLAVPWLAAPGGPAGVSARLPGGTAVGRAPAGTAAAAAAPAPAPAAAGGGSGRTAAPLALATLRLRGVAAEGGAPLADCELLVDGASAAAGDASGAIEVELPPFASVSLELRAAGRVAVVRTVVPTAPTTNLGDVALRAGAAVRGAVADESGRPCAHVLVRCVPEPPPSREDGWLERWAQQAATDAVGAFVLRGPLPPGPARVAVDGGTPLLGPAQVDLLQGGEHDLVLVCRDSDPGDWIEGTVRAADGTPVADAIVHVAADGGAGAGGAGSGSARSRGDGTFRLFRGTCAAERVRLSATSVALDRVAPAAGPFPWGARDVVVELPASPALALRVTCAVTGEPIAAFAAQCLRTTGVRPVDVPRRRARAGERGIAWVDGVAPGPGVLVVWPDDERWLPAGPLAFEHGGEGAAAGVVAVALPRALACPVRVRTASGVPAAGVAVELLVPGGSGVVRDLERLFDGGGSRGAVDVRVARATTDAGGVARLRWHADPRPLVLRVHGGGVAPREVIGVRVGPDEVAVTVDDAARLELALRGAAGARVVLRRGDERLPPPWLAPWQLDATGEGTFAVPAGTWQWQLQRPVAIDGRAAPAWLAVPLGDEVVALRADSTVRVARDVAALLAPGEIAGAAFVDGEPAERVVLLCGEADCDAGAVAVRHVAEQVPDARGAFRFTGVPAGAHALQVRVRCGAQQVAVPIAGRVDLAAGERRVLPAAAIATAPVVVRVRGELERGALLELFAAPATALLGGLDGNGELRLSRVPLGRYRARLRSGEVVRELGGIDVRAGAAAPFDLVAR